MRRNLAPMNGIAASISSFQRKKNRSLIHSRLTFKQGLNTNGPMRVDDALSKGSALCRRFRRQRLRLAVLLQHFPRKIEASADQHTGFRPPLAEATRCDLTQRPGHSGA